MFHYPTDTAPQFLETEANPFLRGNKRLYMAIHGFTWEFINWLCMATIGKTWQYMAVHGNTWQHMVIHGYKWQYMAIHGNTWLYLAIPGNTWL